MKLQINEQRFRLLYFVLPLAALIFSNLGFIIESAQIIPIDRYALFVIAHILFLAALSLVIEKILIEVSLIFFEDSKNSIQLKAALKNQAAFPIKASIFVAVFVIIYIYLVSNVSSVSYLRLFVMLIPSAALFIDSKYFLSGSIRFISGKYLRYDRGFSVMLSYYVNDLNKIGFLTVDGEKFETDISLTDIDFKAFEEECKKNGLVSNKK